MISPQNFASKAGRSGIGALGARIREKARTAALLLLALTLCVVAMPGTAGAVSNGTADGTYDWRL